jgi:hypothetical protein
MSIENSEIHLQLLSGQKVQDHPSQDFHHMTEQRDWYS